MKYNISKVRVSIDHITMTTDDKRKVGFNPKIIKEYRYLGMRPAIKEDQKRKSYQYFHEYQHHKTGNKVLIFTGISKNAFYYPNLTMKFYSSWDNRLSYKEVVGVLNCLVREYNVAFNVAEFHVAVDLISGVRDYYLHALAGCTKSGRNYDPDKIPKFPGTYYFHAKGSAFLLILYDKKKQLIDENKLLSIGSRKELKELNVVRLESRFNNTAKHIIPSLEALATTCFSFIYPRYIKFLEPDQKKLSNRGIKPQEYRNMGLKALRQLLRDKGIKNNFFYYLKENEYLANIMKDVLAKYRWCKKPDKHPLLQSKIIIRPQQIKFIKH